MMLGTEQTKQGINPRKILDFRFQTRAQEVEMEIGGSCVTVTGWCINTSTSHQGSGLGKHHEIKLVRKEQSAPPKQEWQREGISKMNI